MLPVWNNLSRSTTQKSSGKNQGKEMLGIQTTKKAKTVENIVFYEGVWSKDPIETQRIH